MRKHLRDRQEVAHYWANQTQSEGQAGNMFFRDSKIYSYGAHFCIARLLPGGGVAVFTTRTYSSSTGRHMSITRGAATHKHIVYCVDPDSGAAINMHHARETVERLLKEADDKKAPIKAATRAKKRAAALHYADQANEYLAALPKAERVGVKPINTSKLEHVREELEKFEKIESARRAEKLEAAKLAAADDLVKWRRHEKDVVPYEVGVALRLSRDRQEIETSQHARIPVKDAPRLWALVQAARRGRRDWAPRASVGLFELTKIRSDGSMVVGCHDIPYDEIAGIAQALGYEVDEEVTA